ncbi:DUF3881 family protein [Cellulosilyticum ruminicola]|uniref:DUF3881 family protein n=1 Tax=Cellulosilyticum ruminicola TaxID=425254 RepID=UPI0006D22979|nr:DUF3881 family protein [Cellulosilyticum ruminicola]
MESPISAVGFSNLDKDTQLEAIVSSILDSPTEQVVTRKQNKDILAEYFKAYDNDMYVMVRIVLKGGSKKEAKIEIEQCEPCFISHNEIQVEDMAVECVDDDYTYYVICEEKDTGMQFIFWLQNVVEYLDIIEEKRIFDKVKVAGLAMEGTIILPIEKDQEDEEVEREEREKLKVIIQKAREGDAQAQAQLEQEEKDLDDQLKERMMQEDFLSIMSGYFVPTTLVDATYAVLGEIKSIDTRKNSKTGEDIYLFVLEVNDMPLEVLINKKDLVGMPSVGMRFMGTCWLQGTIVTK